jgi:hypothetical protein
LSERNNVGDADAVKHAASSPLRRFYPTQSSSNTQISRDSTLITRFRLTCSMNLPERKKKVNRYC